jgi:hypothetical protein
MILDLLSLAFSVLFHIESEAILTYLLKPTQNGRKPYFYLSEYPFILDNTFTILIYSICRPADI